MAYKAVKGKKKSGIIKSQKIDPRIRSTYTPPEKKEDEKRERNSNGTWKKK